MKRRLYSKKPRCERKLDVWKKSSGGSRIVLGVVFVLDKDMETLKASSGGPLLPEKF